MNFVKSAIKNKQVTLTVLAMVFIIGVYSLFTMPRREDPKITVPLGLVIAYYPGATSAQVEDQVTHKLEQYLFQFEEVKKEKTYSTSRDGAVVVNVTLQDNVKKPDIFWSKLRHQLLITKAIDLPAGVKGPFVNSDFGDTEAMLIGIEGKDISYAQLSDYTRIVEDNLRTIPAASKIKRIGDLNEQITVTFNSEKLSQLGISLQQVVKVLQSQNQVLPSGEIKTQNNTATLQSSGFYQTETELENQIVGTSRTGAVVHLGDIANLKREYAEPTSSVTINGNKSMIISVQMHEGNNVVWFGKDVSKKLADANTQLPSSVKVTPIFSQPQMVDDNITHFIREFFIAIVAVIIVVILLLPFRIATVAAMAIPMTVAVTFAMMHAFHIELHQVSLAALIVVLGMVVDDAIVVADNYVELLDKGVDRREAAWRSAFDLIVPILAATVTIIASFMPMAILSGTLGEFIIDLPLTVTIALASSFVVAMVLTPMLCYLFIKKGLHDHSDLEAHKNKKPSLLDRMQSGYNALLDWCVANPRITIGGSMGTIVLALIVFKLGVGQKFFPPAERNQFAIELWMPTGTKLEKTQEAISRIEAKIKDDKRIVSYATFAGMSAPRVYYNFSPEVPVSNYAQILVNTTNEQTTEEVAHELTGIVADLIPEGMPQVKLMQQGQPLQSPVEVRIMGDDIKEIKRIGQQITNIIKQTEGSHLVRNDFKEDAYGLTIQTNEEARRLGFTTESISQMLYIGMKGATITNLYEGDKMVNIVLRLDANKRQDITDLENVYVQSPVTGASVPLRQIADIKPNWHTGRIMHRNGVRCLTVQTETTADVLPSALLKAIQPKIAEIALPNGYTIEYGGEKANKEESMGPMVTALLISLVLIFFILLFQFRNLKEASIVMLSIPLSLFGAIFGLFVTHNNFGFTAFIGLISLSGIVVRNAIILIDYTNELLKEGYDIRTSAIEAGKRRLRPIFLTAMAAAFGVLPMIISGSAMWSPLASVIAFGVTWSMLMALLTVPVMYIMMVKPKDKAEAISKGQNSTSFNQMVMGLALVIGASFITFNASAQSSTQRMNLNQVTELALQNNHLLKIKQLQIEEKRQKISEDKVKYFPMVQVGGAYLYVDKLAELTVPMGSFGQLPLGGNIIPLPSADINQTIGSHENILGGAAFYQPITQFAKINAGVNVAKTELSISEVEHDKAVMQIKQATEKLYYGLLILGKQKEEAEIKLSVAQTKLYDVEGALSAGKTIETSAAGLQANVADEEQNLLRLSISIDDYTADLKHLAGIADTIEIALDTIQTGDFKMVELPVTDFANEAQAGNTDLKVATLTKTKAEYAIKASNYSYIPDLGVIGGYTQTNATAFLPGSNSFVGVMLSWNIQDVWSNSYVKKQRVIMQKQAEENILNTREQVNTDVAKAYRKLSQSARLIAVADKVVNYRRQDLKIQSDKRQNGLNIEADYLMAKAALAKAEADLFAAQLNYRMAYSDLVMLTGRL